MKPLPSPLRKTRGVDMAVITGRLLLAPHLRVRLLSVDDEISNVV